MPKTILEALKATREIIAKPENWTKGYIARNANGEETNPSNEAATCFCLMGACFRALPPFIEEPEPAPPPDVFALFTRLEKVLPSLHFDGNIHPLALFNDSHTHAEVLALIDRAIELESRWIRADLFKTREKLKDAETPQAT